MSDTRQHDGSRRTNGTDARPRILIVAPGIIATFIEQDRCILSQDFDVTLLGYRGWRDLLTLNREIRRAELVLIWFLGRHSLPAVLMARARHIPVVPVIGGFEVAWIPSAGYGIKPGSLKERASGLLLRQAARILTVSEFTTCAAVDRYPGVSGKIDLVPNAVDTARFIFGGASDRRGVLHVGRYGSQAIGVKGAMLNEVATALTGVEIKLVGPVVDEEGRRFVQSMPNNVKWLGELHGDALVEAYQCASVYFTGSLHESFSLALAEAMSCGCIPVVAPSGALPEVVADTGIVLSDRTVACAIEGIRQAMTWGAERREAARRRIVEHYDLERRRRSLVRLVNELLRTRSA